MYVGTVGSCTDAQICNTSQLKTKIEDESIGLPDPAPILQSSPDISYYILGDDAFALKTWLMTPYGGRTLTKEERISDYIISTPHLRYLQ